MQTKAEIEPKELFRFSAKLREFVNTICASPAFKTSPKSCEFLRHIVENTLNGNVEELKERLIGMTLLGRNATYDTGADAGVRVRANEVRKRLAAYYKAEDADGEFSIEIPPGSYIPRFFHAAPACPETPPVIPAPMPIQEDLVPRLSFYRLAGPTLAALFLCTICMRWQMSEEHPFTAFWQDVFQSHRAVLYLSPKATRGDQILVDMQELKAAAPLLNLAGQFHKQFTVVSSPEAAASPGDVLISLGGGPATQTRFVIKDTSAGRQIIDRSNPEAPVQISGRAALLTIVNGAWRSIRIDGTDDAAISSAVQMLCERTEFPDSLIHSFQPGAITQIVIPIASQSETRIYREMLP